jgi:hypothetical protein
MREARERADRRKGVIEEIMGERVPPKRSGERLRIGVRRGHHQPVALQGFFNGYVGKNP